MADGGVSTLLIAAAASQAVATGAGIVMNEKQKKAELAQVNAERERAKLEATDQALTQTQNFRQALASQLALSSLRSGSGGSLVRQFAAGSVSNYLKDQKAIDNQKKFIDVAANANKANIRSRALGQNISAISSLIGSATNAVAFSGGGGGAGGGAGAGGGS